MDTANPPKEVKFDLSFTDDIDKYIVECQDAKQKPTVKGFANRIGTDVFSLWQWANKKKKDEQGVLIDQFARPKFHAALTKLEALEKQDEEVKLTPKQELFCQYYATDREFFGNGTQSYLEAYEPDQSKPNWYNVARASASQLLANINVCRRITELLEDGGLNDQNVEKQLQLVIMQNADLSSKIAAIREYHKLKGRVVEKVDLTSKGKELTSQVVGFTVMPPADNNDTDTSSNQANG